MGFIVTNLSAKPEGVVHFYNGRGTAEQWIKEGEYALNWTRLSCHRLVANQVRLQLFVLAYNLVERWFRDLNEKRVRRGSFESAAELIVAIEDYIAASNADPKPFVWHKSTHAILDKLAHCKAIYETLH